MNFSRFFQALATAFLGAALSSVLAGSGWTWQLSGVVALGAFFYVVALAVDGKGLESIRVLGGDFEDILDSIEGDQLPNMKIHV